jgi:hypothetical protein
MIRIAAEIESISDHGVVRSTTSHDTCLHGLDRQAATPSEDSTLTPSECSSRSWRSLTRLGHPSILPSQPIGPRWDTLLGYWKATEKADGKVTNDSRKRTVLHHSHNLSAAMLFSSPDTSLGAHHPHISGIITLQGAPGLVSSTHGLYRRPLVTTVSIFLNSGKCTNLLVNLRPSEPSQVPLTEQIMRIMLI